MRRRLSIASRLFGPTQEKKCSTPLPVAQSVRSSLRQRCSRAVRDMQIRCHRRGSDSCAHLRANTGCWLLLKESKPFPAPPVPGCGLPCDRARGRSSRSPQELDFRRDVAKFARLLATRIAPTGLQRTLLEVLAKIPLPWLPPSCSRAIIATKRVPPSGRRDERALSLFLVGLGQNQRPVDLVFRGRRVDRGNAHACRTGQQHIGAVRT